MALDSDSTITDALAQWNDNLAWDDDATKAAAALEAARWLLANRPAQSSGPSVTLSYADLEKEIVRLAAYVRATSTTNRRRFTRGKPVLW